MLHSILQRFIWVIFRTLLATYRVEFKGLDLRAYAETLHPKNAFLLAVWHEQVFMILGAHAWTGPFLTLASRSKDGDYAAYLCKRMGYTPVRGSSRKKNREKGGKEARLEYVTKMSQGASGGITVDGPKGPRQVCKVGSVLIARDTGAPILPVIAVAKWAWEINSWDRHKLALPFTRIVVEYGEPLLVKADANHEDVEAACRLVEERLKELESKVRREFV